MRFSRRQLARDLLLLPLVRRPARAATLESAALRFEVAADARGRVTRRLTHRLTGESFTLPERDFELEFDGGAVLGATDFSAALTEPAPGRIRLEYARPGGPEVRVDYTLPEGKPYVRKQISLRAARQPAPRLLRADLDNWKGIRRPWRSLQADRFPYGSHPIFCESLWAGVEFVAAFNEYGPDGFVLRSRPGGLRLTAEWSPLVSTVVGVAQPGKVREAFLAYIDDIRLAPPRLVACYNSWWTLPLRIGQKELIALARELTEKLLRPHGVFFDIFTIDEGWTDPKSVWEIDRKNLPAGFQPLRTIIEQAGGKLGLWMSPSGVYPRSLDYEWAERNGLFVIWAQPGHWHRTGVSLADPAYRERTKRQLERLIGDWGLGHIKYDGFIARENKPHHELLPGEDSVEPLARHALELLQVSKNANPALVTEPTFLNSYSNYISPWILKYSDTVWANSGGDLPAGIGPAPEYRESHTNAREWFIFSSLDEVWLPQNALQYFDIVHCDPGGGFANHAAMAFGRGRFFVATYINPRFMGDDDWRIYAGLLRWARANQALLRHTVVLRSRVELGEPYAYAHWLGARGVIAVRNPSNETREYMLELGAAGAPPELADAVGYTQYPYRRGLAAGLSARSTLALRLAPWELLFIEIVPRAQLQEPVVIGGRWYRSGTATLVAPDWNTDRLRRLAPGQADLERRVQVRTRGELRGAIETLRAAELPASAWISRKGERLPTVAFELECSVRVPPEAARAQALLLVEHPGREHKPSNCQAAMNGAAAEVRQSSSEGHIRMYAARPEGYGKEIIPYESEWSWHIVELRPGNSTLRFAGVAADPKCRLGLWLWADFDATAEQQELSLSCSSPALPPYEERREREGICLRPPAPLPL
jgi:hypothetical protein